MVGPRHALPKEASCQRGTIISIATSREGFQVGKPGAVAMLKAIYATEPCRTSEVKMTKVAAERDWPKLKGAAKVVLDGCAEGPDARFFRDC